MLWLKQSTAVTFQLGPFVDAGDGVTPETGLATNMDNATTGIRVSKNGVASVDRNSATAPAHDDDGYYRVELSATDTNTPGTLHVQYEELAVTLPAWKDFMVVTANVWDSFFGADTLQADLTQILGGAVPTPAVTGIPDVNVTYQGDGAIPAPAVTGVPDVNTTYWADGAIPAQSITGVPEVDITHVEGATTLPELAVGVPPATPTLAEALMLLFMAMRNKLDVTTTIKRVHNDAGTIVATKALTDDGSTYSEAEMISG